MGASGGSASHLRPGCARPLDCALMLRHRSRFLRPLTTLVLALCFGFFTAESVLADVHDDDATHEELVQVDGTDRHAASHVAHGDEPGGAHSEESPIGSPAGEHPGERSPDQSGHDQHACHHGHVHGGWFRTDDARTVTAAPRHPSPIAAGERAPSSRDAEPQLRPPIA